MYSDSFSTPTLQEWNTFPVEICVVFDVVCRIKCCGGGDWSHRNGVRKFRTSVPDVWGPTLLARRESLGRVRGLLERGGELARIEEAIAALGCCGDR
jgi:hypothetical protein